MRYLIAAIILAIAVCASAQFDFGFPGHPNIPPYGEGTSTSNAILWDSGGDAILWDAGGDKILWN